MYLLPGLKRLCGRTLAQILDEDNVVSIWRIAKLFQLTRLEDQCTEYMAKIIEKVAEPPPTALTRVPINLNARRAIDTADWVVALRCAIDSCLSDLMIWCASWKRAAVELECTWWVRRAGAVSLQWAKCWWLSSAAPWTVRWKTCWKSSAGALGGWLSLNFLPLWMKQQWYCPNALAAAQRTQWVCGEAWFRKCVVCTSWEGMLFLSYCCQKE